MPSPSNKKFKGWLLELFNEEINKPNLTQKCETEINQIQYHSCNLPVSADQAYLAKDNKTDKLFC